MMISMQQGNLVFTINQSNMKWTLLGKDLILEREKLLRMITEKRIINDREKEDWFVWLVS